MKNLATILSLTSLFLFSSLLTAAPVGVGEKAPPPIAILSTGERIDFGELYGKGRVLVYFFPKSGTPGCTSQACNLRDNRDELKAAGITVIGVSRDRQSALQNFITKNSLPFSLVADPDGRLGEFFGVPSFLTMFKRQAFLIEDGVVIWRDLSVDPDRAAQDILEFLQN